MKKGSAKKKKKDASVSNIRKEILRELSEILQAHRSSKGTRWKAKKKNTRGFLRKCQPPARQRFPGGNQGQERRAQCQAKKTGTSRRLSRRQPGVKEGNKNSAVLRNVWRQRHWCLGRSKYIALSYAWQNDVKASVRTPSRPHHSAACW